jgi:hypothetical protein
MPALTLTTALLIAGGVVLLAVIVNGWWTLRRARLRAVPTVAAAEAPRTEPTLESPPSAPEIGDELRAARRAQRIDALIDAIAPLALDAPISGDFLLAHAPATRRAGSKPFIIEGLDAETGEWTMPLPGRRYGEVQAGVQLASRSGALNQIEYSEFVQKIQAFADAIGASPDFPDMRDVVARARELDAMTGPLDAQLTVTLRSNSVAWSASYIQQIAARHGLVAGVLPGRLVLPAPEEGAPPVLTLAFDAQAALADDPQAAPVRECQLVLDVPQTAAAAEPFPAWHRVAQALSDDMDAALVDDQGQPITLHAFAAIGQELQQLYARLEALDLAAGSAAARRLFS